MLSRLIRLARAYLQFADDEPALWRLMFGPHAEAYRAISTTPGKRSSYDYLPASLLGLYLTGVVPEKPTKRDALFAWGAVHGAAALRNGCIPAARVPIDQLSQEIGERMIRSLG